MVGGFEAGLELLREGQAFSFEGIRFSFSDDGELVVEVESSYWLENITEQTAFRDLQRAKSVAEYLAGANAAFGAIYRERKRLFMLVDYYGRGGGMEVGRLVDGRVMLEKWIK